MHGCTHGRTDARKIFTQYSGISSCSLGSTDKQNTKTPEKGMRFQLIENTKALCKEDKLIIPASLQHRAVSWYHHYLQHPGYSRLEEKRDSVMYWKGIQRTIQSCIKSCRSCQVNKRHSQKYGHVPPKLVIPATATSSLRAPRELPFPIRLEFVYVSRYHTYN